MELSVIIPVYNAVNTVRAAVESILRTRLEGFEVILVDDGSTDGSPELLSKLCEEYPNVRAMKNAGKGPGEARNTALDAAQGSYLMFSDSDDTFAPDAVATALAAAKAGSADMLIFALRLTDMSGVEREVVSFKGGEYASRKSLAADFSGMYAANVLNSVCNKVFRTSLLREHGIRFPSYRYGEDRLFALDALAVSERTVVIPDVLYNYFIADSGTLITKYYAPKPDVCLEIDGRVRALAEECGATAEQDVQVYDYMLMKSLVSCVTSMYEGGCTLPRKARRAEAKRILSFKSVRNMRPWGRRFGLASALMRTAMKSGFVWLNVLAAKVTIFVKRKAPKMFSRAKHRS